MSPNRAADPVDDVSLEVAGTTQAHPIHTAIRPVVTPARRQVVGWLLSLAGILLFAYKYVRLVQDFGSYLFYNGQNLLEPVPDFMYWLDGWYLLFMVQRAVFALALGLIVAWLITGKWTRRVLLAVVIGLGIEAFVLPWIQDVFVSHLSYQIVYLLFVVACSTAGILLLKRTNLRPAACNVLLAIAMFVLALYYVASFVVNVYSVVKGYPYESVVKPRSGLITGFDPQAFVNQVFVACQVVAALLLVASGLVQIVVGIFDSRQLRGAAKLRYPSVLDPFS
jgi:hypothetical protein